MKISIKKVLMAGTAIAAMGGAIVPATAQAQDYTLTTDAIWASSAGATGLDVQNAQAGDSVDVDGNALDVTDSFDGDAGAGPDDGGGVGDYTLGAVTDGGAGDLFVYNSAGAMTASIASVQVGNDFAVDLNDTADAALAVSVTGNVDVAGTLAVTNNESSAAAIVSLAVGGDLDADTVTVTGGANAGSDAFLVLGGDATIGTGNLTLTNGAGGAALLFVSSSTLQTITGDIDVGGAGDGEIWIANTSAAGAVFNGNVGNVGTITLNSAGSNVNATFRGDVAADNITLGDGADSDTNTVTFSSSGTMTVSSLIDGTANDTGNVTVAGGGVVNSTGIWGSADAIDTVTISGGTELDADADISATAVAIGSGSTLDLGAMLYTSGATLTGGTINLTAGGGVDGDISGTGTLDVDADATVTGSVDLTTIDIADNATLTVDASNGDAVLDGTITINDAAGLTDGLTLENGGNTLTVSGNILTAVDGQGLISLADTAGTVEFEGSVGSATASVGAIDFATGAAATAMTTTKNLYVDAITMRNADDSLSFLGDGNTQIVTATIDSDTAGNEGNVVIGDGTTDTNVTFMSRIGGTQSLGDLTVDESAAVTFQSSATFGGAFINDGTVNVEAGHVLTAATTSAGVVAGGTFVFGVDRTGLTTAQTTDAAGEVGTLVFTTVSQDISADTVRINVEGGTLIDETISTIIDGVDIADAPTIADTFLTDYEFVTDGANGLDLTVDVRSATALGITGNNATVLNVLLTDPTLAASTDTEFNALRNSVLNAGNQADFERALEQATPTVDGSSYVMAVNVANTSFNMVSDRLAMVRTGDDVSGMTTGNITQGVRGWTQAFGSTGKQDERDGIKGYDYDSFGAAVGLDTENIGEDTVLGVAFSYADTEADSDNGALTSTETGSYQFTVYGEHQFDQNVYLNGMAAYANNSVETSRIVANSIASGEFDANQYTFRAEVGRDYQYEKMTLTPHVLGHWSHFDPDSYTETGAGGAGQTIDQDSLDIIELGLGGTANWLFRNSDGSYFSPELNVEYRYDFAGDEVEMTSQFVAGGAAFTTRGFDAQQSTIDAGAGFTYYSTDNWELSAQYNYEWKEDFDSHSGVARAAYRF